MVTGGFTRKNAPKNKNDTSIPDNEIDWSLKLSNEKIRKLTNTTEIKHFCEAQHLKYIAHVTRMDNNTLQKQFLFCQSDNQSNRWRKLANLAGVDESQLRRTMVNKKEFKQLLSHTIGSV